MAKIIDDKSDWVQKIKLFALFLLLAIVFWFFMSISSDQTERLSFKFQLEPSADLILIQDQWQGKATALVETSGLFNGLKQSNQLFNIKREWIDDSFGKSPYVLLNKYINEWQTEVLDIKLLRFEKDTLWLPIKRKSIKIIPVHIPQNIKFKSGYRWVEKPKVMPDSIEIVGSSVYLDVLNEIATDTLYYDGLDHDLNIKIPIKSPFKEVFVKAENITFFGAVTKFTEETFDIPLAVSVKDKHYKVEVFPKIVKLTFQLPVNAYADVSKKDFEISCKLSHDMLTNDSQTLIVPQLTKKPESVVHYSIDPPEVRFLVYPIK